jgi:hypothetical protein
MAIYFEVFNALLFLHETPADMAHRKCQVSL